MLMTIIIITIIIRITNMTMIKIMKMVINNYRMRLSMI